MIEFENIIKKLLELEPKIKFIDEALKIEKLQEKLKKLEFEVMKSDFWQDNKNNSSILEDLKNIKTIVDKFKKMKTEFNETFELVKVCDAEKDVSLLSEIKSSVKNIESEINSQTVEGLLNCPNDKNNAILTIHSGAGGTESQDWVQMIFRMYSHWAQNNKFKMKILDFLNGEEVGFKSISTLIEGRNAYGLLKSEIGVHRLVRISPFDSNKRRHTSFAAVEVIPQIDDKIKIEILPSEIKVDVFRASGAGGQHVNTTSSAVRITHIKTGIVVTCQNERSQIQNKEIALKTLKSKLFEKKEKERIEAVKDIKGVQREIAWGSQIRSYVFMPYTLVKDHRTNLEIGNIEKVMNGQIGEFINEYLKFISK